MQFVMFNGYAKSSLSMLTNDSSFEQDDHTVIYLKVRALRSEPHTRVPRHGASLGVNQKVLRPDTIRQFNILCLVTPWITCTYL